MRILTGPFDHCVLQRGGVVNVTGRTEAGAGVVTAVMTKGKRKVAQATGKIREQQFELKFKNLPVGGPYEVTFTAGGERIVVKDVLVGDVWVCAGQSQMQGLGYLKHADKPVASVRAFYMDDRWDVAKDPIHNIHECVDEVHMPGGERGVPNNGWGVGPAVAFGQEMLRRTKIPQGLIACGHGGSSMAEWDPAKKDFGGKSMYGAMVRRVVRNGGGVAGVFWSQGESETGITQDAVAYTERMVSFVKALRKDFRFPRMPIVMMQIGRYVPEQGKVPRWDLVKEQQRLLPKVIPMLAVVPTIDLEIDDDIHIGKTSNTIVGKRVAEAMDWLRTRKGPNPQITFKRVKLKKDPNSRWGGSLVELEFGNVTGKLTSLGRPSGFGIGFPSHVNSVELDGSRVVLGIVVPLLELSTQSVQYGPGTDPYCNITDEAGHAMPGFGPIHLGQERVLTPFVKPRVSQVFSGVGDLTGLAYPENMDSFDWQTKNFVGDFCNIHDQFKSPDSEDRLLYLRTDLDAAEPMKLVALFGYDGPVKLWVDGKELFHDPKGTNPGIVDKKCIPFEVEAGRHAVIVGLGSNCAKAWGIYLRFQRLDITKAQAKRKGAKSLPVLS